MRFTVKNAKVHEGRRAISFKETPNRSGGFRPEGIVLHDTAGRLDRYSSVNWFLDPTAKASHFVIERDGEITQMAKLTDKCWHAGRSMYKSRPNVNAFAVERFRGIRKLDWWPQTGVNVILGAGDSGKSTILEAIAVLLSPINDGFGRWRRGGRRRRSRSELFALYAW